MVLVCLHAADHVGLPLLWKMWSRNDHVLELVPPLISGTHRWAASSSLSVALPLQVVPTEEVISPLVRDVLTAQSSGVIGQPRLPLALECAMHGTHTQWPLCLHDHQEPFHVIVSRHTIDFHEHVVVREQHAARETALPPKPHGYPPGQL